MILSRANLAVLLTFVVAASLLAGCGGQSASPPAAKSSPPSQPTSASSQHGFLARASNGAIFIQWTRTGDTVRGTLSEVYTNQSDPTQAQSESHSFTGVVSGSSITLTLDSGDNWNGTLSGSGVTLSYTSSDGALKTFTFRPASVAQYNNAVGNVQSSAGQAQAGQNLDSEAATVQSDIESLSQAVTSATSGVATLVGDLKHEQSDLATTLDALTKVQAEAAKYPGGNYGGVCYDASGVPYDASGVEYDENSLTGYDADSVSSALDSIASGRATLRSDFQKFQANQAALPSYYTPNAPSAKRVNNALSSAASTARQAHQAMASYIAQAKQLLKTANGYASQAQVVCNKVGG